MSKQPVDSIVEDARPEGATPGEPLRRKFLRSGGVLIGAVMGAGEALAQSRPATEAAAVPDSMKTPGAPVGGQLYGQPSPFEAGVIRNVPPNLPQYISASSRTPLQDLDGIITPNGLFYERHHGGVPRIDPASHRLLLHGLVERPLLFSLEDLRRFPSVSRIHFLECSGNPTYKKPYGKTASDIMGLVSCAEWTGVPLKTLLDEAGLRPGAAWVVAEGADAAALDRSIPLDKCLDDALVVYSQNGERLRPEQGYPMRLLLPGFEGNMNIKWLRRLRVAAEPVAIAGGDLEIHRPDARRHGAPVHLRDGSQVDHHRAFGRAAHGGNRLRRDPRHRLERTRAHRAGGGVDRWRKHVGARRVAGARPHEGSHGVSP